MARRPDPQVAAVALAYTKQVQNLRTSLAGYVQRLWVALGTYRAEQMATFVREVVPVVTGAQTKVAALTVAYLAAERNLALGGTIVPVAIDPATVTGAAVRNGTAPQQVYERPFHLVWRQLGSLPRESGAIDQAIQAGLDRATELALTDVQLAKTHASRAVLSDDKNVTGYRRIIEGAQTCGLCIVASTQRYHKKDLLPMHPACDCSVAAIYGDNDPGQIIDPELLEDVHQRILDRFGVNADDARAITGKGLPDYRDILVTHDHSELGPVLGVRGQPFTSAADLGIH